MIHLNNVTKAYEGKTVLQDFSLTLPDKGFCAVTGRSGTGKTTLLNIIAGLCAPDSGTVQSAHQISMVFQEDRLLPWDTALSNASIASDEKTAKKLLCELGLESALHQKPKELSGGMKRRVAIARALAVKAKVYIMDEPLKGLDSATRSTALEVIRRYTKDALLIMVTHDEADAADADIRIEL